MFEHLRNTQPYHSTVLLVGDPARAQFIADEYLEQVECVTTHRGLLGLNGTYHNHPVSIQTTGIGSASTAIVMEELVLAGVTRFYRLGSCCLIHSADQDFDQQIVPLLLPTHTISNSRVHENYHHWLTTLLQPRYQPDQLTASKLQYWAHKKKIPLKAATTLSVESYYHRDLNQTVQKMLLLGVDAIDMETGVIFDIADHYHVTATAILNPYDVLAYNRTKQSCSHQVLPAKTYKQRTRQMIRLALDQCTKNINVYV